MEKPSPDQLAALAAKLLQGRFDAEPHQIRAAVATARMIFAEALAAFAVEMAASEPEAPAAPETPLAAAVN